MPREQWGWEMPQDPRGRGILSGLGLWGSNIGGSISHRGCGWAHPWVSVRRAEGLVRARYLPLPVHGAVLSSRNPPEPTL